MVVSLSSFAHGDLIKAQEAPVGNVTIRNPLGGRGEVWCDLFRGVTHIWM